MIGERKIKIPQYVIVEKAVDSRGGAITTCGLVWFMKVQALHEATFFVEVQFGTVYNNSKFQ
jgi:hypothetical protein